MRYLNQLKPHEKFVASGVYHTVIHETGEREEAWSIHDLPDRTWFIRADYRSFHDGVNRLVEVLYEPSTLTRSVISGVTRINVFEYDSTTRVRQNLVFFEDYVQAGFTVDEGERVYLEFALPSEYVVAGACDVMRGLNISHLAGAGQDAPPVLVGFDWKTQALVWESNVEVNKHADTEMLVDQKSLNAIHYRWNFATKPHLDVWLDRHDIPLKLTSTTEETLLQSYSWRLEPKL